MRMIMGNRTDPDFAADHVLQARCAEKSALRAVTRPLAYLASITSAAVRKASTAVGTPQYTAACSNTS